MPEVKKPTPPKAKKEPKATQKNSAQSPNHITMKQLAKKVGYSYVTLAAMVRQGRLVPSGMGNGGNKMGRQTQYLFSPAVVSKMMDWIERGKQYRVEVIKD